MSMFPFCSYFHIQPMLLFTLPKLLLLLLFFLLSLLLFPATGLTDFSTKLTTTANVILPNNSWHGLMRFLDAGKGSRVDGMAELKAYFFRFGYLTEPVRPDNISFTDIFDEELETALLWYQKNLGLPETGKLDYDTMRVIVSPRCGVRDFTTTGGHGLKTTRRFAYFYRKPRWVRSSPMRLTYAFSPAYMIDYVSLSDLKTVFRRAFSRWSAVIPMNFTEAEDYSVADIRIGWYHGDHGDGEAFDGVLGVLAHAFSPENGRFHLDAAERWAVDLTAEKSKEAVDLESVATHEIGHVLGLAHSSAKEAVMYPSFSPRTKKVELRMDDVEGIQELYGPNPKYRYNSLLESDLSSGRGMMDLETRKGLMKWRWSATMIILACFFSLGS